MVCARFKFCSIVPLVNTGTCASEGISPGCASCADDCHVESEDGDECFCDVTCIGSGDCCSDVPAEFKCLSGACVCIYIYNACIVNVLLCVTCQS